jgi:RNA polymerase sigma factor (sigma-70 family)
MNETKAESDQWDAFRQGDRSAFAQIYFDHYEGLLNYGRRFGLPPEQVEDTIQDLFVELWQYRNTTSATTSIRFYLLRALRNQLSSYRHGPVFADIDEEQLQFTAEFSFEQQWIDSLDEQQQWQALQRALNALTPRQREVLYLRFFNNLDYPQIAATMNLSYQAARNQVYLALKAIREQFPINWQMLVTMLQVAYSAQM